MIIILFVFLIGLCAYKAKNYFAYKAAQPKKEEDEEESSQFDDLASISALQETVLIDQGKQIDMLSKEVTSLKRKIGELEK